MALIMKRKVKLGDGTILKPGDKVSEAHLKAAPILKQMTEEEKPKPKK
jgi:hypothetical protein